MYWTTHWPVAWYRVFSSTGTEKVSYLVIYTSTNASDQVFDHQVKGFWHLKRLLHQSKLSLAQLPCNKSQSESNSSSRAVNYKPKWLYKQRSSDQISTCVLTPLQKETLWSNPSHRISRRMETWSSRWGNKEFPKGRYTEVIQSLWVNYSWPDTACSVSEQWDFVFSHWQMALAYCTTSLSIQVRGSGNSTEPSKKPRWPPWRGSTCMTFSRFSVKQKEAHSSSRSAIWSRELNHLKLQ